MFMLLSRATKVNDSDTVVLRKQNSTSALSWGIVLPFESVFFQQHVLWFQIFMSVANVVHEAYRLQHLSKERLCQTQWESFVFVHFEYIV
jgi:hypothetical protein